jgi:hypothetical protein
VLKLNKLFGFGFENMKMVEEIDENDEEKVTC